MNSEIKKEIDDSTKTPKRSSLSSRLKTACICLPILFFLIYYQFTYTILMISKLNNYTSRHIL